jgi:hypothetical protein
MLASRQEVVVVRRPKLFGREQSKRAKTKVFHSLLLLLLGVRRR